MSSLNIEKELQSILDYEGDTIHHNTFDNIVNFVRLYAESINNTDKVTRFEVIDHRECISCRGRMTANYLQQDGSYKEEPCQVCDGSGMRGGRVFGAFSNPETSIIKVDLSFQDEGQTLKVFVTDELRAEQRARIK